MSCFIRLTCHLPPAFPSRGIPPDGREPDRIRIHYRVIIQWNVGRWPTRNSQTPCWSVKCLFPLFKHTKNKRLQTLDYLVNGCSFLEYQYCAEFRRLNAWDDWLLMVRARSYDIFCFFTLPKNHFPVIDEVCAAPGGQYMFLLFLWLIDQFKWISSFFLASITSVCCRHIVPPAAREY